MHINHDHMNVHRTRRTDNKLTSFVIPFFHKIENKIIPTWNHFCKFRQMAVSNSRVVWEKTPSVWLLTLLMTNLWSFGIASDFSIAITASLKENDTSSFREGVLQSKYHSCVWNCAGFRQKDQTSDCKKRATKKVKVISYRAMRSFPTSMFPGALSHRCDIYLGTWKAYHEK